MLAVVWVVVVAPTSVMVTVAVLFVVPEGTYCTWIVQLPPAAIGLFSAQVPPDMTDQVPVAPPVLVMVGAAVSVSGPVEAAATFTVTKPVFVLVFAGLLVNVGRLNVTVAVVVVPVRLTVWLAAPVAVTFSVAALLPADASEPEATPGAKLTLIVQVPPTAIVAGSVPQLFVSGNNKTAPVLLAIVLTVSGPIPVLVRVTGLDALVVWSAWFPKASEAGVSVNAGATPVPDRATAVVAGDAPEPTLMFRLALKVPVVVGAKAIE
jgi:hypothetical protein